MTRQEFNDNYFVEPVFEEFRVFFYVYKREKIDYVTPAIDVERSVELTDIKYDAIKSEVRKLADSFICEKYNIVE